MYVARYTRSAVEQGAPVVELQIEEPTPPGFAVISTPGKPLNLLAEVGDCAVILAPTRGELCIIAYSRTPHGAVDATVTLEPLGKTTPRPTAVQSNRPVKEDSGEFSEQPTQPKTKTKAMDIDVLGHVAGRGDVWVKGGEWIAGPQDPARIEGFSIDIATQSNAPDLVYGVVPASRQNAALPRQVEKMVPAGSFAGSRGRATPAVGLKLQLRGRSRTTHVIVAQVLFLGAPPVKKQGADLNFLGPTGREPIIGLAISVNAVESAASKVSKNDGPIKARKATGGRVRVFRSA
ncbi:MAG: hypothetical protein M9932_00630 [Xanthobacteraceae bacterium]|nr:hypothetical protein [Xanthobacteraceae bacterium]